MITSAVHQLAEQIVTLCLPEEIWLYSRKVDLNGETTSFKLCVVTASEDKASVESDIYLHLDCPVPYDVIVYTAKEWTEAGQNPHSFARSILTKGHKLYGKTAD
ncbi:MAG: hypothetical protein IJD13_09165 [Oscillospiraceae bacterium]|nr:hypothetical protein [Oscillospiraceae bacterium]